MRMKVGEVARLHAWLESKGLKQDHSVDIEIDDTVLGGTVIAKVKMTEDEGIFIDLTDYTDW